MFELLNIRDTYLRDVCLKGNTYIGSYIQLWEDDYTNYFEVFCLFSKDPENVCFKICFVI